ncbi:hypothetical protein GUJ93_ZPchr0013g37315 [Zizania palustris]|uniref:Uncharacterized protein n=1 Tax=Zizania palustris TaxID=103762 RepID=A0A8J6BYA3_ZIZPA|nr:hypothetical protein GUJ93_ZPchr0013g37315 [Zizania palustris]
MAMLTMQAQVRDCFANIEIATVRRSSPSPPTTIAVKVGVAAQQNTHFLCAYYKVKAPAFGNNVSQCRILADPDLPPLSDTSFAYVFPLALKSSSALGFLSTAASLHSLAIKCGLFASVLVVS